MNLLSLAARNPLRNVFRTVLTVLGVAVAVITFMLLRTVLDAWTVGAEHAAQDRVATRHKVTFINYMPVRYADELRKIDGIRAATFANWFGGKDPNNEQDFFASLAVDTESFFQVYDEVTLPPEQLAAWKREPTGAVIGANLAKKKGWEIGDRVRLTSAIFPGEWPFVISGIYRTEKKSFDNSQFLFHWKYWNENQSLENDAIGWTIAKIENASLAASISQSIDKHFDSREVQTLSMSERALNQSFMASFSAVLQALNIVSIVILLIMTLILGNTIAMAVRERTNEYGVLRAVGFLPKHLAVFVVGEALTIGGLGGVAGLLVAYPLINGGLGLWIEENMGGIFPHFRISPVTAGIAMLLAFLVGAIASAIPAYQASRVNVIEALRKIG